MAGGVARHIYTHRKEYARAARKIGRVWRRYRMRKKPVRYKVGENIGSGSTKNHTVSLGVSPRSTRTLYFQELTGLPQITTQSSISSRSRQIVNCRGFKLCIEFENLEVESQYFNFAVVCSKHGNTPPGATDFFRAQDDGNTRSVDFSNSLSSNEFHCLPINTDIYNVLMHRRFHVPGTGANQGYTRRRLDRYIKINRQLRYPQSGDIESETPIHLIYWSSRGMKIPGTTPVASAFQIQYKVIHYFREPK